MSIHRIGLRLGQPCRQQQRLMNTTTTTLRSATRRTPNTTTSTTLPSGQWGFIQRRFASKNIDLQGFPDNSFNRERAAVKAHAAATSDIWRKLSIYVVIPSIILSSINAKNLWDEHWEHWEHMPPLEERVEYPYQNIRTRNFFWGDGDKTLFWNDKVNYHNKDKVA